MPALPAAPPAAPSTPAAPAASPPSAPGPSNPPPSGSPLDVAFSDMEGFASDPNTGKPAKLETPPGDTPPGDNPPEETPPGDKPSGDKPPGDKPAGKPPTRTAELRTAYEQAKLELNEVRAKNEALTLKLKSLEGHDIEGTKARVEELTKRSKELEDQMRFAKYEQSSEFKQQYEKPFLSAYATGRAKAKSLKVISAEGERQGTEADFDTIVRISDDGQAAEMAAEMFGNQAPLVLYHRERVWEANQKMNEASEEFKKTGSEREKQTNEQLQKVAEQRQALWKQHNQAALEKFPQFFKPVEGDEKGNELLQKGYELADIAFGTGEGVPPEKMVAIHASVRNRAAAFGRLVYQNKGLQEKVTALEAELSKFKASVPGGGEGGGPSSAAASKAESWETDLEGRARPA